MSVLISCIGGSDPIRSGYDGPILHILRNYNDISCCYFFLSEKINSIHNDENKNYYRIAYNDFCKKNNRDIEFKYIETFV